MTDYQNGIRQIWSQIEHRVNDNANRALSHTGNERRDPDRPFSGLYHQSLSRQSPPNHPAPSGTPMVAPAIAAAAIGAAGTIGAATSGGIFGLGGTIATNNANERMHGKLLEESKRQFEGSLGESKRQFDTGLSFNREQWEREWHATKQAGLYHPSQFANLQNSGSVGFAYGRRLVSTLRVPRGSHLR